MGEFKFKDGKGRASKPFKYEDAPEKHQGKPDVISMLKKMQQQLVFLERKIDLLLGKSSARPSRSDGQFGRQGSGPRDDSLRERSFSKGKKPFPPKRRSRI